MPAGGRFRFTFVGEEPLIFRIVATLTVANPLLGLALPFAVKYLAPESPHWAVCEALESKGVQFHVPGIICWYAEWWVGIEFTLLACTGTHILWVVLGRVGCGSWGNPARFETRKECGTLAVFVGNRHVLRVRLRVGSFGFTFWGAWQLKMRPPCDGSAKTGMGMGIYAPPASS